MWHCFLYMRNRNGETYMAEVKETLLTAEGLKKLEEELNYYKSVRRIEVAERIKIAIMEIFQKTLNMMMRKTNKLSSKAISSSWRIKLIRLRLLMKM